MILNLSTFSCLLISCENHLIVLTDICLERSFLCEQPSSCQWTSRVSQWQWTHKMTRKEKKPSSLWVRWKKGYSPVPNVPVDSVPAQDSQHAAESRVALSFPLWLGFNPTSYLLPWEMCWGRPERVGCGSDHSREASGLSGVVESWSSHTAADSALLQIRHEICSWTVLWCQNFDPSGLYSRHICIMFPSSLFPPSLLLDWDQL